MLSTFLRIKFNKIYSFNKLKYVDDHHLSILKNKYEIKENMNKFNFLKHLHQQNKLDTYYNQRNVGQIADSDIYFLMSVKSLISLTNKGLKQLYANMKSTFFKCLLMKQFYNFSQKIYQYLLITSLNEQILDMSLSQVAYCLQIISQFQIWKDEIQLFHLQKAILKYKENNQQSYNMLIIHAHLLKLDIHLKKILTQQLFQKLIQKNKIWDFHVIYSIYFISQKLNFSLNNNIKNILEKSTKSAIQHLKLSFFQSNYLVFLLQKYPEYLNLLSIQHFSARAYIRYLKYYFNNSEYKITPHKIPYRVLQQISKASFNQILNYRINLGIQTIQTVCKNIKYLFTQKLNAIVSFLQYNRQLIQDQIQLRYIIQKQLIKQLSLNNFNLQIYQKYSIKSIILLVSMLTFSKICSITFWKNIVTWVQKLLQYHQSTPNNTLQIDNLFVVHLYIIVNCISFKQQIRDYVRNMIVERLKNAYIPWQLTQLLILVDTLRRYRIGVQQIWILTQKRIMTKLKQAQKYRQLPYLSIYKITLNFNSMQKGSMNLWQQLNYFLPYKYKKQLLQECKLQKSLIKKFIKLQQKKVIS